MLVKTKGIVIKSIKYGDNSAIVNIFTRQFGLLGFMVRGLYGKKSNIKTSYLLPLNLLDLVFENHSKKNLQSIKEINILDSYYSMDFSLGRQAMFAIHNEVLQQLLKENQHNDLLFDYLEHELLPNLKLEPHFWHLPYDMLSILHHYGCLPNADTYLEGYFLDIKNGIFTPTNVNPRIDNNKEVSKIIVELINKGMMHLVKSNQLRNQTIDCLLEYFRLHVNEHFQLKSREVYYQMSGAH